MCTVGRKRLDEAFDTIVEVFQRYASTAGDKYQLNFTELKRLVQNELTVEGSWDSRKILDIMDDLDRNNDGNVSFEEFVRLLTLLMMYTRVYFKEYTIICTEGYISRRTWKST